VLSSTGVSVGPRMTKVFAEFEKMDVDGDQKVSLDEILFVAQETGKTPCVLINRHVRPNQPNSRLV